MVPIFRWTSVGPPGSRWSAWSSRDIFRRPECWNPKGFSPQRPLEIRSLQKHKKCILIHSAKPTVLAGSECRLIFKFWDGRTDRRTYLRTDTLCKNSDHYRSGLWIKNTTQKFGRVDSKVCFHLLFLYDNMNQIVLYFCCNLFLINSLKTYN